MNHSTYDQRLGFVRSTLRQRYGQNPAAIVPIDYDPQCPFPYNNFVYRVDLRSDDHEAVDVVSPPQPGTAAIPNESRCLVMRLSNPAAGLNDQSRVQNEVAAMTLARQALHPRHLVPAVYGWESAASGQGWILMEHMRGNPLDAEFEAMTSEEKRTVLKELATILRALHQVQLPNTAHGFGGLCFDFDGNITTGPLTVFHCGPFSTYPELIKGIMREQLIASDKSSIINGWQSNGLRSRLEEFISKHVDRIMLRVSTDRALVHGDFSTSTLTLQPYRVALAANEIAMNNVLFDKESFQITTIIDFDWARIGLVADEILNSFHKRYARLPGPYDNDPDRAALRHALLHGFPSALPPDSRSVNWKVAYMWDTQLSEVRAIRPSVVDGIEGLSFLYSLLDLLNPGTLCNEVIVSQRSKEGLERELHEIENLLDRYLRDTAV